MIKRLIHAVTGVLLLASAVQHGWRLPLCQAGSVQRPRHNWKPRLGGVYWLDSLAGRQTGRAALTLQSSRPVLVDIKTTRPALAIAFGLTCGIRISNPFILFLDGTDVGTPASPEDAMQIFGATGNAEFIPEHSIPLNLTGTPRPTGVTTATATPGRRRHFTRRWCNTSPAPPGRNPSGKICRRR